MQYAGFWLRLVAAIVDRIIASILTLGIVLMLFFALNTAININSAFLLAIAAFYLLRPVILILYNAIMESSPRQATLGKQMLGIYVTSIAGSRISFLRALGRNAAKIISELAFYIGYIMIAFTEKKQGLHDIIAECLVLKKKRA